MSPAITQTNLSYVPRLEQAEQFIARLLTSQGGRIQQAQEALNLMIDTYGERMRVPLRHVQPPPPRLNDSFARLNGNLLATVSGLFSDTPEPARPALNDFLATNGPNEPLLADISQHVLRTAQNDGQLERVFDFIRLRLAASSPADALTNGLLRCLGDQPNMLSGAGAGSSALIQSRIGREGVEALANQAVQDLVHGAPDGTLTPRQVAATRILLALEHTALPFIDSVLSTLPDGSPLVDRLRTLRNEIVNQRPNPGGLGAPVRAGGGGGAPAGRVPPPIPVMPLPVGPLVLPPLHLALPAANDQQRLVPAAGPQAPRRPPPQGNPVGGAPDLVVRSADPPTTRPSGRG